MSESTYLGQINRSTDITRIGIVSDITIGLTFKIKRLFVKIIKDKNNSSRFNIKKAFCHSLPKKNLNIAIKIIGIV
jgi:hypothetical protein